MRIECRTDVFIHRPPGDTDETNEQDTGECDDTNQRKKNRLEIKEIERPHTPSIHLYVPGYYCSEYTNLKAY